MELENFFISSGVGAGARGTFLKTVEWEPKLEPLFDNFGVGAEVMEPELKQVFKNFWHWSWSHFLKIYESGS